MYKVLLTEVNALSIGGEDIAIDITNMQDLYATLYKNLSDAWIDSGAENMLMRIVRYEDSDIQLEKAEVVWTPYQAQKKIQALIEKAILNEYANIKLAK